MPHLLARAKLNLGLRIVGRRPDGYHDIDTILHAVDLWDRVEVDARPGSGGIDVTCDHPGVPAGEDNLAYRAAALFCETAGLSLDVTVHIDKRIPVAAGLGGGSADAAAVLLGLYAIAPDLVDLHQVAADLGADVPFFLCGPAARAGGTGTDLSPLPVHPRAAAWRLLLVNPGIMVSTAWAYGAWDGTSSAPSGIDRVCDSLTRGSLELLRPVNDLEPAVVAAHPELGGIRDVLEGAGARAVSMSGSGSTFIGVLPPARDAGRAMSRIQELLPGAWVCETRLARGPAVEIRER